MAALWLQVHTPEGTVIPLNTDRVRYFAPLGPNLTNTLVVLDVQTDPDDLEVQGQSLEITESLTRLIAAVGAQVVPP